MIGDENCLTLNIYKPQTDNVQLLPILFWIHSGGFMQGTSFEGDPKYLMDRDIILVTVNFRQGALGFLSTGDEHISGNMGLKDQSLALKWLSKNIESFGGDSERVTLAGVSSGSASAHYHYLSPMSKGLFSHGISFSGTALSPRYFINNPLMRAKLLAEHVACPTNNIKDMVECLRIRPARDLCEAIKRINVSLQKYRINVVAEIHENIESTPFPIEQKNKAAENLTL